jgi:hypothetical protein
MCAPEDASDSAFSTLLGSKAGEAQNFYQHLIAMHGVFDCVSGNEDVTRDAGNGGSGYDEAITVVMKHEAANDLIA